MKWTKCTGIYEEQKVKLSTGRQFKIGVCDNQAILSTKSIKSNEWYVVKKYPYKKNIISHIKNVVKILEKDELLLS